MSIKITADSTCDLPARLLQKHRIDLFSLYIIKEDKPYRDGLEIFPDDVYDHVEAGGAICTTAAVNLADYMVKFRDYSEKYDAVIHINISSEFSCCHQNAKLAAAEFKNVFAVDSRNLSMGHGLVVLAAAELAAQGLEAKEIVKRLNAMTDKVKASFVLERLDYMRKGGRCSAVTVLGANLLKLKPCIEVTNGKMGVGKKYRGGMVKCIGEYVADCLGNPETVDPSRVVIVHSGVSQELLEAARAAVKAHMNFQDTVETRAGCTISCHCGPGTLGIMYCAR